MSFFMRLALGSAPAVDVSRNFAITQYTGNGNYLTLANGLRMSDGGMVMTKARYSGNNYTLCMDSANGEPNIQPLQTTPWSKGESSIEGFTDSGIELNSLPASNTDEVDYVAWAFRSAKKFFRPIRFMVSSNGENQVIEHGLGIAPGFAILFDPSSTDGTMVAWHKSLPNGYILIPGYNVAALEDTTFGPVNDQTITVTNHNTLFPMGLYVFADDPAPSGHIRCGGFDTDSFGNATVNLGWAPQFLMLKLVNSESDWWIMDTARGWVDNSQLNILTMNNLSNEVTESYFWNRPKSNGFTINGGFANQRFIYMAIRAPGV